MFCEISAKPIRLPGIREVNGVKVLFLPEAVGKTVEFTFEKQDFNGYIGTDSVVFTVLSPSGKNVWETSIPDDGDDTNRWKVGPRQKVTVQFAAQEAGIYTLNVNSSSAVDMQLLFDNSTSKNAAWALSNSKYRFFAGKLDAFLALPPMKTGESRMLSMQICVSKSSKIKNMLMQSDNETLIPAYNLPAFEGKSLVFHEFKVNRSQKSNICELTADVFEEIVSLQFPEYGEFLLCSDYQNAKAFLDNGSFAISNLSMELQTPGEDREVALKSGADYLASFLPAEPSAAEFKLEAFGQKLTLAAGKEAVLHVSKGTQYGRISLSTLPKGKLTVSEMTTKGVQLLSPASGSVFAKVPEFSWTSASAVKVEYTIEFRERNSGKRFQMKSATHSLSADMMAGRLFPGLWNWTVTVNGKTSKEAFFTLAQNAETSIGFLYDYLPKRDSLSAVPPEAISFAVGRIDSSRLDFSKSVLKLNGNRIALKRLDNGRIATAGTIDAAFWKKGVNQIRVTLEDQFGNRSYGAWAIFVQESGKPEITNDKYGNFFFNGAPFYPLLYYGYKYYKYGERNAPLPGWGFNCMLRNSLDGKSEQLDAMLALNMKNLDSGGQFQGHYTPKGEDPMESIKAFTRSDNAHHQARLGCWMDEMDVHRSEEYIRKFLECFGDSGIRGVCSCNNSKYASMAEIGDYLMVDVYANGSSLFFHDKAMKTAVAAGNGKPVIELQQGFARNDPKINGFVPSARDVEYCAFATIRLGLNAVGLYQCGEFRLENTPETWQATTDVYMKLAAISFLPYAERLNSADISVSESCLQTMAVHFDGAAYLIVQNSSHAPVVGEICLKGTSGQARVLFEERSLELTNGRFFDSFEPAATHIYRIAR